MAEDSNNDLPAGIPPRPESGPALCVGKFLTPEQGKAMLERRLARTGTVDEWKAYSDHVKKCILRGADLDPLPRRTPLNPIVRNKRAYDGYTVESVGFECVPGFWVSATLYRPAKVDGPFPVVLCPNGHGGGRCAREVQTRCATLARMGAAAMSLNLFGWGELPDQAAKRQHLRPIALTMQTWTNMRALDFLLSLDGADPKRVAVTGASGGGTQSFLLAALDERVAVSVPVVMVSSYMFGGCPCESGKPIHRSAEHFTNNTEIAAMAAPRPMLVVSDGADWTSNVPKIEFPFIRVVYGFYGAAGRVANAHFGNEGHDYGPSKRRAMYEFVANRFGLDLGRIQGADGEIDESPVVIEDEMAMQTFDDSFPFPEGALTIDTDIEASLKALQE
ncbi:acetylxylan esterase [Candidatus Sumerlaeota bacterium]|nr:acetylxylan esterase [Candidatus Sumerlaeota bacterium]